MRELEACCVRFGAKSFVSSGGRIARITLKADLVIRMPTVEATTMEATTMQATGVAGTVAVA
ncbi:MAG: hypothetical protein ACJ744_15445, partial [Gaiellaceae bacterium]